MRKFAGILLFFVGAYFAREGLVDHYKWTTGTNEERLGILLKSDIENLENAGVLPAPWKSVKTLRFEPLNEEAKLMAPYVKSIFKTSEQGQFTLEIMMDQWREPKEIGLLIQYNLIDKDGNMIWELSRTLVLN